MNTELRKKFEEAANIEALKDTNKGRNRNDYFISAMADHENGFREGFLVGVELGYKESIAQCVAWLEEKVYNDKYWGRDDEGPFLYIYELLADFEADMNKL